MLLVVNIVFVGKNIDIEGMTLTVRELDPELHKEFRHICIDEDVSMNQKVKDLIIEYVEKHRNKKK